MRSTRITDEDLFAPVCLELGKQLEGNSLSVEPCRHVGNLGQMPWGKDPHEAGVEVLQGAENLQKSDAFLPPQASSHDRRNSLGKVQNLPPCAHLCGIFAQDEGIVFGTAQDAGALGRNSQTQDIPAIFFRMHGEPDKLPEDWLEEGFKEPIPDGGTVGKLTVEEDGRGLVMFEEAEEVGPEFALQRHIEVGLQMFGRPAREQAENQGERAEFEPTVRGWCGRTGIPGAWSRSG